MSSLVTLDSVTLRAPDGQTLFEDLTLALGRERIGLVGRNGVGKSTLLRLIAGEVPPTAGAIRISARVARLRQDLNPPPGATLSDMIGVSEPLARLARIERGETAEEMCIRDSLCAERLRHRPHRAHGFASPDRGGLFLAQMASRGADLLPVIGPPHP